MAAGDLRIGDMVHTVHENTGEWGDFIVSNVSIVFSERIKLKIGDTDFTCSLSHKFKDGNAWISADQLRKGQKIEGLVINEIANEKYGEVVQITVDEAHTYVCEGMISHNKSLPTSSNSSSGPSSSSSHSCEGQTCSFTVAMTRLDDEYGVRDVLQWSKNSDNCAASCPCGPYATSAYSGDTYGKLYYGPNQEQYKYAFDYPAGYTINFSCFGGNPT